MTLTDIITTVSNVLQQHKSIIVISLMLVTSVIEISPVKVNPWSKLKELYRRIVRAHNHEVLDAINKINEKLDAVAYSVDENEIDRIRFEILTFASSLQKGENYTQEAFNRIFKLNEKYHVILQRVRLDNGQIDREMEFIKEVDEDKRRNDSYLK